MELDNFFLAEYDPRNIDHKTVIIKLENADRKDKNLGDLEYHIEKINKRREYNRCNHAYISYYDDIPIGFISIYTENDSYQISYGIIPERRQEYLGALLLQEFSEKMYEVYPEIGNLTLTIKLNNEASRKLAKLVGFERQNTVKYTQRRM